MANLTIAIDDELLRAARIRAVAEGTSVNELCRQAIERYAGSAAGDDSDEIVARLRAIARKVPRAPAGEASWPGREALYGEVLRERGLAREPAASSARIASSRRR